MKYIKKGDPSLPEQSNQEKKQTLLHFAVQYLITAIRIGTDILNQYQSEKQLSPDDWLRYKKQSFESLAPPFKEIALSLRDQGLCRELKEKYGWDDNSILEWISIRLKSNDSSVDYFFFLHS